ncbi:MAG: LemA family protein [Thermoleophilaceae bacterium]|nr:LemA family protein [Thermoleophilaceae bacterium]
MNVLLGAGAALLLMIFATIVALGRMVRAHTRVIEARTALDFQLHRRHDLVAPLVQAVSVYARHEQPLFAHVTEVRSELLRQPGSGFGPLLENQLATAIAALIALPERYPELAASHHFNLLVDDLALVECEIQSAATEYSRAAETFNARVKWFLPSTVAVAFGYQAANPVSLNTTRELLSTAAVAA